MPTPTVNERLRDLTNSPYQPRTYRMAHSIVSSASGARDAYQLPLALHEAGLLAEHVTDFYTPDVIWKNLELLPQTIGSKLAKRHADDLPSAKVHSTRLLASRQLLMHLVPPLRRRWQGDQQSIGLSALRKAQKHNASLLMYAGYAYSAFTLEDVKARRRGVVQYHPHIRDSAAILRADLDRYPQLQNSLHQLTKDELDHTNQPELEIADLILCCSTFTARTCQSIGVDARKIRIVPYGSPPSTKKRLSNLSPRNDSKERPLGGGCRFLFTGSGIHRKGLHHLLKAWKQAELSDSTLTVVSRHIDPQIRLNFDPGDGVIWRQKVSDSELDTLFFDSDVFVMPSLVEGFGYVFLEALSRGCYCIGTPNTALPDLLRGSSKAGSIVDAGDWLGLAASLEMAAQSQRDGLLDREACISQAARFSWSAFRTEVACYAQEFLL